MALSLLVKKFIMRTLKLILLFPVKLLNILTSRIPVILYNIVLVCGAIFSLYNIYEVDGLMGTIIFSFFIFIIFSIIFGVVNWGLGLIHDVTGIIVPSWDKLKSTNDVDYKMGKKYTLKYFYKEQQKEEQNLSRSLN